ncbi:ATP-binding protein [Nocardioides sp. AN3]
MLPHVVIDALDLREQSARGPMTVLGDYLSRRRMLIVLDNCEHLVDAAADLTNGMLRVAPDVRVLATSRQSLGIAGEHVYPVPPLPVGALDEPVPPGTAAQYPSVTLFVERAAAVIPGFSLTAENETAVVRLCQRLEGIPLAIELAAVQLRVLSVDELAGRLDDRFRLLRAGGRNLPERHRTLKAVVDWSHDLCTSAERTLWARASMFAGGFGVDALEAVCSDDTLSEDDVLETVAGLLDKSIFLREERGKQVRFRMVETLRSYGQARLAESEDEAALRRRHRDWYLRQLETAGEEWAGPRQEEWASWLMAEHANLRRAFEFCLSQPGEARAGLRMASVPWFWFAVGHPIEGSLWLDRALALDVEPSRDRAWALATAAYIAPSDGDAAMGLAEAARSLAVELEDPAALAYATHVLGVRHYLSNDLTRAVPLLVEALELYACVEVPAIYPEVLRTELVTAHILVGAIDEAAEVVEELIERWGTPGERWELAWALWGRGFLELMQGELTRSESDLCESIRIQRVFHDIFGLALAVDVLAWTTAAKGDGERAATLLGAASNLWQTVGAQLLGSAHMLALRDRFEKAARQVSGDATFAVAFGRGRALTLTQIIALALREQAQPAPETARPAPVLTRREREVAGLVAEGMSNKDIAARLVISLRTAETHVENILTKLEFNSRSQIARWLAQQRPDSV